MFIYTLQPYITIQNKEKDAAQRKLAYVYMTSVYL